MLTKKRRALTMIFTKKGLPVANSLTGGRSHSSQLESMTARIIARVKSMRKLQDGYLAAEQACVDWPHDEESRRARGEII